MKQLYRITEMRVVYVRAESEEEAFSIYDTINDSINIDIEECSYMLDSGMSLEINEMTDEGDIETYQIGCENV